MPPRDRDPKPIKPLVKHAREYDRVLRELYLNPFFASLTNRLATVAAVNQAYAALAAGIVAWQAQPVAGVPLNAIIEQLGKVNSYNRSQLIKTFRSALSIDVRPFLHQAANQAYMAERIADNMDLIKTLPPRTHEGLRRRIAEEFAEAPFDRQRLMQVVRDEYGSQGYNARRITRDQASKLNGQLTEHRQRQLGITEYRWLASMDERTRENHADKNGKIFQWSNPPLDTGHPGQSIQCRCQAIAQVDAATKQRLRGT